MSKIKTAGLLVFGLCFTALVAVSPDAWAQFAPGAGGPPPGGQMGGPPPQQGGGQMAGEFGLLPPELGALDLTDAQAAEIELIAEDIQTDWQTVTTVLKSAEQDLDDLINQDTLDESGVRDASQAVAVAKEELDVLRAVVMSKVRAVLTTEQKTLLDTLRAARRNGFVPQQGSSSSSSGTSSSS